VWISLQQIFLRPVRVTLAAFLRRLSPSERGFHFQTTRLFFDASFLGVFFLFFFKEILPYTTSNSISSWRLGAALPPKPRQGERGQND
jgi:hypothetical protein